MNEGTNRDWIDYIFNLLGEMKGCDEPWEKIDTPLVNLPVAPYKVIVLDRLSTFDFNDPNSFNDLVFTKEGNVVEAKYAVSANQGRIIKTKIEELDKRVSEMEKEIGILSKDVINKSKSVVLNAKSGVINDLILEGTTYQNLLGQIIGDNITNSIYLNTTFYGNYFYKLDMTKSNHLYNKPISLIKPNTKYKLVLDIISNDSSSNLNIESDIFKFKTATIPSGKTGRYIIDTVTENNINGKKIIDFVSAQKATGSITMRFFMINDGKPIPEFVKNIACVGDPINGGGYKIDINLLNEGNIKSYMHHLDKFNYKKSIVMNTECIEIPIKELTDNTTLKGFENNTQYKINFNFKKELKTDGDMFIYVTYTDGTEEVYSMINDSNFKEYNFITLPNKTLYFIRFVNNGAQKGKLYFKSNGMLFYELNKSPSEYQELKYTIYLNKDLHGLSDKYTDKLFYNGYSYIVEYRTKHLKNSLLNNISELKNTDNGAYITYQINLTTSYGIQNVPDQQYSLCNKFSNIGNKVFEKNNNEGFYIENSSNCYLYIRSKKIEGNPMEYINNLKLEFIIPSDTFYEVLKSKIPPISFNDNVRFGTLTNIPARMSFSINTDLIDNIKLINSKINSLQDRLVGYLEKL